MAKTDLPIVVAGGGIGGLAVALALARKGRSVHVLESSADFREVGAGIQLGPNVFRMFDLLGLTEAINASAVFPDNLIMRDGLSGEEVTRIPLGDAFRARFKYPYAVIHTPEVPRHLRSNDVVLWAGPKTHLVHYPLRRGELYNLVVVFHSNRYEEGWDTYGDPEELRERFRGQRPEVLEFMAMVNAWKMWVLCDRDPVSQWSRGRVTLLGDAAHPMLQYLAQGGCMAIEDAGVLADQVQAAKDDFVAAFVAYQKQRYLRTTRVQMTARFYGDIYHAADAVRDLRRQLLAGRTPEQAYNGVAWLYDGI